MIEILTERLSDNFRVKISGHAMYSKGEDIVCAAVSTLFYSLMAALEKDSKVSMLKSRAQKGCGEISFKGGSESRGAYKMAVEGLTVLARQYPENITINKIERNR